jgi:flagellar biosynthetic protein FlhB
VAEDDADKTEEPTGKRLSEARDKGMVAKSMDFNSALSLLVGAALLWLFRDKFVSGMEKYLVDSFKLIADFDTVPDNLVPMSRQLFVTFLVLLAPFVGCLTLISLISSIAQVGFLWTTEPLGFHFGKVFGFGGLKRIFSPTSFVEVGKSVAKMFVVALVAYQAVSRHYAEYLAMSDMDVGQICHMLFSISFEVVIRATIVLLILGIADLVYQKRKYRKEMRMSKQEVKDEARSSDGDPHIKGKIKSLRMQMHKNMMMKELPKATVVITNPTFIAIAIRYRQAEDPAPVVVAKGKRLIAERIREVARQNDIPIVEDKPLARGMYDMVEPGEEIPQEFFAAVAEILAYVYSLKGQHAA